MGQIKDLTGQRFGKLVAKKKVGATKENRVLWLCECDCGNTNVVSSANLLNSGTKSCGCGKKHNPELTSKSCCEKLGISITSFYEIKYRLGYKGKENTLEQFNEVKKIVDDIKKRCDKVALSNINWYWEYVRGREDE